MECRKVLALRGPNLWATVPVLEAWLALGGPEPPACRDLPGLIERLLGWLPGLSGEPVASLAEPTSRLAHAVTRVAVELQRLTGSEAPILWQTQPTREPGVERVVFAYEEEETARACLDVAVALVVAARDGAAFPVRDEIGRLRKDHQWRALGPSTRSIVHAAVERGIPFRRLNTGSLVQFGHGAHQRRILAAETDATSAIAEDIAQDKELTRELLQAIGVPVPAGRPVTDADDAWAAALEIGPPVVVKPQDGNQGRGVATNLTSREQVQTAYAAAHYASRSGSVIVEKYAPGDDYRVLVIGDRVIAAARRDPARIIGDGQHTVAELVDAVNADPRRGEDHATSLSKIPLDAISLAVLAEQNLTPESVPLPDQVVLIRRNANLSTGGTATDVTERVHPAVARRCIEAARMVGLDVAGIDVIAADIQHPLEAQGGIIVEVNAAPGLRMHLEPSVGQSRPVGRAILELMFPPGQTGRVPIVAITGVNGKTTTTRFIAHLVRESGQRVGMTCTDGIFIEGRRIDTGDCSGPASARAVLMNPTVEAAVLETARGGILRAGLGFDRCDVAVLTNVGEGDHLGISDVHTVEELAHVKGTLLTGVAPHGTGVLNAADPLVVAQAHRCPGSILYFAIDPDHPVIVAHRGRGGRAAFVRHGEIVLAEGSRETGLARLSDVPLTHGGRIGFQVENTLASVAAAWALGLDLDTIRSGLDSFSSEMDVVPGRFNLLEIQGATVVVDYGHNTSALLAMIEAIEPLPHQRRLVVYSAAGDRRDEDMIRQGEILAQHFDQVFLYEDQYIRGRQPGDITRLIRQGLARGPRVREGQGDLSADQAVAEALKAVRRGDLLLIQADTIDGTVDLVKSYLAQGVPGREIDLSEALEAQPGDAVLSERRPG